MVSIDRSYGRGDGDVVRIWNLKKKLATGTAWPTLQSYEKTPVGSSVTQHETAEAATGAKLTETARLVAIT